MAAAVVVLNHMTRVKPGVLTRDVVVASADEDHLAGAAPAKVKLPQAPRSAGKVDLGEQTPVLNAVPHIAKEEGMSAIISLPRQGEYRHRAVDGSLEFLV